MKTRLSTKLNLILLILAMPLLLTGCADLVEIQERDFVMAMGIAYQDQLQITFALPDLNAVTGQSSESEQNQFVRTIHGNSFAEVEDEYNRSSRNRLDLRHLQAIVFDASIGTDPVKMKEILEAMNDHYDLSHNVLVFYCLGNTKDLMGMEDTLDGSIGDYLRKLDKNNQQGGLKKVTIGHLITSQENHRILAIPVINHDDMGIFFEGSVLFQNHHLIRTLTSKESDLYHIMEGEGSGYLFHLADGTVIRLTTVQSRLNYSQTENRPNIRLTISGTGRTIPGSAANPTDIQAELNAVITKEIREKMIPLLLDEHVDFLNLYEKSSYRQRDLWFQYQDAATGFITDLNFAVLVDVTLE